MVLLTHFITKKPGCLFSKCAKFKTLKTLPLCLYESGGSALSNIYITVINIGGRGARGAKPSLQKDVINFIKRSILSNRTAKNSYINI